MFSFFYPFFRMGNCLSRYLTLCHSNRSFPHIRLALMHNSKTLNVRTFESLIKRLSHCRIFPRLDLRRWRKTLQNRSTDYNSHSSLFKIIISVDISSLQSLFFMPTFFKLKGQLAVIALHQNVLTQCVALS